MAGPYYVDVTTGDDGDTGLSEALAFATLGFAANTIAAGEICYVKASASYTADDPDTATTNWEITTAGTITTPIVWIGYTSVITDGGVVTVDAQDTNTTCMLISVASTYNVFKNFKFTQSAGIGVDMGTLDYATFKNCSFDNNASHGLNGDNGVSIEGCVANNNGGDGFNIDLNSIVIGCAAHTNTSDGFYLSHGIMAYCLSYKNGSANYSYYVNNTDASALINCVADGENGATTIGMHQGASTKQTAIVNCIFFDLNTGISDIDDSGEGVISRNNLFFETNTNRTNWIVGEGDVTGSSDPFTDSPGEDYTLKSGSEAIDAGYDAAQAVSDWGL